ncbi:MAG: aminotransferase class I/II-fold pyridoxal phosphate-dependent enzyme, partial [Actinobacteria bacterium]|nr:aminotransferase class I/II-fold pyridoxal phosphate-dependent enzyme [Actinomycetota bacterium]
MNVSELYHDAPRTSAGIAVFMEAAVREGRIPSDDLLPPVRTLAESLEVSPATVASAYRRLKLRGVVVTDGRRGTRVSATPPLAHPFARPVPPGVRDLSSGNPDPALLPSIAAALSEMPDEPILYGHDAHDARLIQLARDGFDADGISSDAMAIVGGALDGLERVLRVHLAPGDRVGLEDPGWRSVYHLIASLNLIPVPVPIDDDGPLPDALQRVLQSGLDALIVTPRAQNPTGAALERGRASELERMVSVHPDLLLIEDDHAGPVSGSPYESMVGEGREKWAVIRSMSKSFGPDLRVALMAGDAASIARVEVRRLLGPGWVSHILQRTVAHIWSDPTTPSL